MSNIEREKIKSIVFDIETNSLFQDLTTCHCLALLDCETGERKLYTAESIQDGLALLDTADVIYGHNIVWLS